MTARALRPGSAKGRFPDISTQLGNEDSGIPRALGFLLACAASLAAWAIILGAAYAFIDKLG